MLKLEPTTCHRIDSGSRVILKGTLSLDLQAEDIVEILAQGRIEPIVERISRRDRTCGRIEQIVRIIARVAQEA